MGSARGRRHHSPLPVPSLTKGQGAPELHLKKGDAPVSVSPDIYSQTGNLMGRETASAWARQDRQGRGQHPRLLCTPLGGEAQMGRTAPPRSNCAISCVPVLTLTPAHCPPRSSGSGHKHVPRTCARVTKQTVGQRLRTCRVLWVGGVARCQQPASPCQSERSVTSHLSGTAILLGSGGGGLGRGAHLAGQMGLLVAGQDLEDDAAAGAT